MNMNAIDCKDSYLVTDDNGEIRFIAKNNKDNEILNILNKENIKEKLLKETQNLKDKKDNLEGIIIITPILHLLLTGALLTPPIALLSESTVISQIIIFIISAISLGFIPNTIKKIKKGKSKINYYNHKIKENTEEVKKINKEIKNLKKATKYQEIAFYKTDDYFDEPILLEAVNPVENQPKVYKLGSRK